LKEKGKIQIFYLLIISALIALAVLLKEKVFVLFWVGEGES
jgi:hypothetical protein